MMFAKIFGSGNDQILAIIRSGDSDGDQDSTEVRFFFKTDSPLLDLCETALGYYDKDKAQHYFDNLTEEQAREVVNKVRGEVAPFFS